MLISLDKAAMHMFASLRYDGGTSSNESIGCLQGEINDFPNAEDKTRHSTCSPLWCEIDARL